MDEVNVVDVVDNSVTEVTTNGEDVSVTEVEVVETPVVAVAPVVASAPVVRNKYKKTDRVRKAKLHEKLEAQLRTTEKALVKQGLENVSVVLERNSDATAARYARAIFDVTFNANGKSIAIRGKVAEEVLGIARGVRLLGDLLKTA